MKIQHPLLFLLCLIIACHQPLETINEIDEYGNQITYTIDKENQQKEGLYTINNKTGTLIEEAHYKQDTLHGVRKLYSETGILEIEENYQDGTFAGPYITYYANEQVKFIANYTDGVLAGETKSYYESGQLKEIVAFKNNLENGDFIEYHPNGKLKAKGAYLNGDNEHGPLELYDENGGLIRKMNCEKGVCRTSWTKEDGDVNSKKI